MLAPFATLAFLTMLWLVVMIVTEMLGHSGTKFVAALKGHSALATAPALRPIAVRVSQRSRVARALYAQPELRAAA